MIRRLNRKFRSRPRKMYRSMINRLLRLWNRWCTFRLITKFNGQIERTVRRSFKDVASRRNDRLVSKRWTSNRFESPHDQPKGRYPKISKKKQICQLWHWNRTAKVKCDGNPIRIQTNQHRNWHSNRSNNEFLHHTKIIRRNRFNNSRGDRHPAFINRRSLNSTIIRGPTKKVTVKIQFARFVKLIFRIRTIVVRSSSAWTVFRTWCAVLRTPNTIRSFKRALIRMKVNAWLQTEVNSKSWKIIEFSFKLLPLFNIVFFFSSKDCHATAKDYGAGNIKMWIACHQLCWLACQKLILD